MVHILSSVTLAALHLGWCNPTMIRGVTYARGTVALTRAKNTGQIDWHRLDSDYLTGSSSWIVSQYKL